MKNILFISFLLLSTTACSDIAPLEVINSWGYQEKEKLSYNHNYCLDGFSPSKSSYLSIRSKKNSLELSNTKYRFALAKEVYPSEIEAKQRESSITTPQNRNSKQSKQCDLRKAKRFKNTVYFVHTDVGVFQDELQRIFGLLINHVSTSEKSDASERTKRTISLANYCRKNAWVSHSTRNEHKVLYSLLL